LGREYLGGVGGWVGGWVGVWQEDQALAFFGVGWGGGVWVGWEGVFGGKVFGGGGALRAEASGRVAAKGWRSEGALLRGWDRPLTAPEPSPSPKPGKAPPKAPPFLCASRFHRLCPRLPQSASPKAPPPKTISPQSPTLPLRVQVHRCPVLLLLLLRRHVQHLHDVGHQVGQLVVQLYLLLVLWLFGGVARGGWGRGEERRAGRIEPGPAQRQRGLSGARPGRQRPQTGSCQERERPSKAPQPAAAARHPAQAAHRPWCGAAAGGAGSPGAASGVGLGWVEVGQGFGLV
jgi:hypothetical protein